MSSNPTWINNGNVDSNDVPAHLRRESASVRVSQRTAVNSEELPIRIQRTMVNAESEAQPTIRRTVVNDGMSDSQVILNSGVSASSRRRRSARIAERSSDQPSIEANAGVVINLNHGDFLRTSSGYDLVVQKRIGEARDSGESDIYLCRYDNYDCVVKIFRRAMRNVEKKIQAFRNVKSDYIAPIIDTGFYANRYYEVYNYYPYGSLADELKHRTFSFDEIGEIIIPQLTTALNDLHNSGILHRDIKPANIMWKERSKKSIVLIDFGLSSVIRDSSIHSTIVIPQSQVGGTRAYEAPEVHDNIYTKESDYYSMGIVLYELFCGKVPEGVYTNGISQSENMPKRFYELLLGLTYADIKYRHDKRNPNRRWTCDEIIKWWNGVEQPIPGTVQVFEGSVEATGGRSIPPFSFQEKTYTDIDSLCAAMATDWENGKACIMRGALLQHLRRQGKTNAQALWASQIDDITNNASYNPDQKLLHVISSLSPNHPYIACPLGCFTSPAEFGQRLMACMRNSSPAMRNSAMEAMRTLLSTTELSTFVSNDNAPEDFISYIKEFEAMTSSDRWNRQKESIVFELAYCFSGERALDVGLPDGSVFETVDDLKRFLVQFGTGDFKELYSVCEYFLDGAHQMKPQVFAWLRHQGYVLDDFNQ